MSFTFKNEKYITFLCPNVLKPKNFLDGFSNLALRLVKDSFMASLVIKIIGAGIRLFCVKLFASNYPRKKL